MGGGDVKAFVYGLTQGGSAHAPLPLHRASVTCDLCLSPSVIISMAPKAYTILQILQPAHNSTLTKAILVIVGREGGLPSRRTPNPPGHIIQVGIYNRDDEEGEQGGGEEPAHEHHCHGCPGLCTPA